MRFVNEDDTDYYEATLECGEESMVIIKPIDYYSDYDYDFETDNEWVWFTMILKIILFVKYCLFKWILIYQIVRSTIHSSRFYSCSQTTRNTKTINVH